MGSKDIQPDTFDLSVVKNKKRLPADREWYEAVKPKNMPSTQTNEEIEARWVKIEARWEEIISG